MTTIARTTHTFLGAILCAGLARSQGYDVTVVGEVPGAYLTYAKGLNDHGDVVGMALFIPGGRVGWTWSETLGHSVMPQPPGMTDFGAVDINDAGVIAGDGGGDSGVVWRYTAGTYELLGVLPGTAIPHTAGISESGAITGTSYGTLFYTPHHSLLASPGAPMVSILDDSYAYDINDQDQIAGTAPGLVAYRFTPPSTIELLPALGARFLTAGHAVNNHGDVVGVAASTAEHSDVPFLYTDTGGMQEIGDFGGRAFARDVNDSRVIVGEYEPGSGNRKPWVWTPAQGVRFLNDEIDPALQLVLHNVYRVNEAGQILARARDLAAGEWIPVLLDPIDTCPGLVNYCGAAQNPANTAGIDVGTCDSTSASIEVTLYAAPTDQFAYLLVGDGMGTVSQPPGAVGDLCVAGGSCLGRYALDVGSIDDAGRFVTDIQNALSDPCGGAVQIAPGATWSFQYWHRQPQAQPATFSEAVRVTFH